MPPAFFALYVGVKGRRALPWDPRRRVLPRLLCCKLSYTVLLVRRLAALQGLWCIRVVTPTVAPSAFPPDTGSVHHPFFPQAQPDGVPLFVRSAVVAIPLMRWLDPLALATCTQS